MSIIDKNKIAFVIPYMAEIAVLSLLLVNLLTIQLVYPDQRLKTADRNPLLSWNGMQGDFVVFLDDNPEFASPATANVAGNSYKWGKELDFGTYYWKVESGPFSSSVGKFAVVSSVVLSRSENEVKNEGNTEAVITAPSITGAFMLGVNESVEIGEKENVKAEQA